VSSGWQDNYSAKTRQAGWANEQSICILLCLCMSRVAFAKIKLWYQIFFKGQMRFWMRCHLPSRRTFSTKVSNSRKNLGMTRYETLAPKHFLKWQSFNEETSFTTLTPWRPMLKKQFSTIIYYNSWNTLVFYNIRICPKFYLILTLGNRHEWDWKSRQSHISKSWYQKLFKKYPNQEIFYQFGQNFSVQDEKVQD
jgi:hypothetical protein